MTYTKLLLSATAVAAIVSGASNAFAEDVKITIESWRTDDLTVWQDKIIPAFEAANPKSRSLSRQQIPPNTTQRSMQSLLAAMLATSLLADPSMLHLSCSTKGI